MAKLIRENRQYKLRNRSNVQSSHKTSVVDSPAIASELSDSSSGSDGSSK